jgi:ABC-type transport system involved in cytochrome bd biosynthesis fused ATPase/permease subunit
LVGGVERLDSYFRLFLAEVIVASITAVSIVGAVILIDPVVGAIVAAFAVGIVFMPAVEYRTLGSRMGFWSQSYRPLAAEFVDNLQGMATLKTFGAARRRGRELAERSADVRDAATQLVSTSGFFWGLLTLIAAAGVAGALSVGALRLADGELTVRQLLLILLLAGECFLPARAIHDAMHTAVWGMSKVERAFSILETAPDLAPPSAQAARARTQRSVSALRFEDVTFRYRAGRARARRRHLRGLAGRHVVGASGPKTTIASRLLQFFDPQGDQISIDAAGLRDLKPGTCDAG